MNDTTTCATCGRPAYFDERVRMWIHAGWLPSRRWHEAKPTARELHPAGADR